MIDTYNNRDEKETEKTFEDLKLELSKEDNEIIDNYIHKYVQAKNEADNRVKYSKQKEEDVKLFFSLLDSFFPADMANIELLNNLAQKIKNNYGI